jgi:hypothetical protein
MGKLQSKKILVSGINQDDAFHLMAEGDFLNMVNGSVFWNPDKSARVEPVFGNRSINNPLAPAGTNKVIGAVEDFTNRIIYYWLWNSSGNHAIFAILLDSLTVKLVIQDSDVIGGLRFDKLFPIIDAYVLGKEIVWNNRADEPMRLNPSAAMEANGGSPLPFDFVYSLPINREEITLITLPPAFPPSIQKEVDGAVPNNFIAQDSFQFAWQYVTYDGHSSVTTDWSAQSRLNAPSQTENRIKVTMDTDEVIPTTAMIVRLWVRDSDQKQAKLAREWDRRKATDNTDLVNHNANTAQLTHLFYNNKTGETLDSVTYAKAEERIPTNAGALAIADNRIFIGDVELGKDAPQTTSLQLTLPTGSPFAISFVNKNLYKIQHRNLAFFGGAYYYQAWYVYLSEVLPKGLYEITSSVQAATGSFVFPAMSTPPITVALSGLVFRGTTLDEVVLATRPVTITHSTDKVMTLTTNICSVTGISASAYFGVFKNGSPFKAGMAFYDKHLRRCTVVTKNSAITIPKRDYAMTNLYTQMDWALDNTDALNEIPDWAYYYAPLLTDDLRSRNYITGITTTTKYSKRNADGSYTFTDTTYITDAVAIALDTSSIIAAGLGYAFAPGDQCVLTRNDNTQFVLPVIGQEGKYILVKAANVGDLATVKFIYEIYTPYQQSQQEGFYAPGKLYKVDNPTQSTRGYSILNGSFDGSSYIFSRNFGSDTYVAEAMSPNDAFYQKRAIDAGRINVVSKLGKVRAKHKVIFSNKFIPGTALNGSSSFDALNEQDLSLVGGAIRKLQLTSRIQDEGQVLLAICENAAISMYLNEQRLSQNTGSKFLVKTENVIGQENALKGSLGTMHPESVREKDGNVFWWDLRHATQVCMEAMDSKLLLTLKPGVCSRLLQGICCMRLRIRQIPYYMILLTCLFGEGFILPQGSILLRSLGSFRQVTLNHLTIR